MKISQQGLDFLKDYETLSLQPYSDKIGLKSAPIKVWSEAATIGYGHLILKDEWSKYKNGITIKQAEDLLLSDLVDFEKTINSVVKKQLKQNEYDALVILAFNIGVSSFSKSSLLKLLNGQAGSNYPTLELAWKAFNKDNGKISNGLVNRRASEWNIFSKNIYKRI